MLIKRKSIEKVESSRPASSKAPAKAAAKPRKPKFAPITLSEQDGVRYLHFGTEWVQGAMRIRKPDWPELEYAQQMNAWLLWQPAPRRVAQLGLGTGALTKFCYKQFPEADVTAVELNPNVIAICRALFELPPDDARLAVREMDALDFVLDPANRNSIDVLQVDLYDQDARGPVLDSPEFYQACHDCLTDEGIMMANVFGEFDNYDINLHAMEQVFDAVVWLPEVHDANIVVIAFKRSPQVDFSALYERAGAIKRSLNLPAKGWVTGLKEWMQDRQD